MSRCEITELDESGCAHCAEKDKPRSRSFERSPLGRGWFEARYPGQCAGCGEPFTAGAHITAGDGSASRWIAECCAEEAEAL